MEDYSKTKFSSLPEKILGNKNITNELSSLINSANQSQSQDTTDDIIFGKKETIDTSYANNVAKLEKKAETATGTTSTYFEGNVFLARLKAEAEQALEKATNPTGTTSTYYESNVDLARARKKAEKAEKKAKDKAKQTAKAAIISRNMSHNLGSHVLSYTQSFLLNKVELRKDGEDKNRINQLTEADIRGLAHLMHYLQERQDFIASVAMCQVPYFSPIPFKEAIFDCLNPDYISKRHPNTPQITNFLLDNIARSEGYTRYGEHKLRVSYYERKENKVIEGNKVGDEGVKELNPLRDKTLFLPGGMIGRQAIMSIIENIIRNVAKHEKHSDQLNIYLQLLEAKELQEHLNCRSNFNDEKKRRYETAEDKDVLYYLLISYAAKEMDKTLDTLNTGLESSYIDDEDNIESSYKGMKEIRVCASWLRGITDEEKYEKQSLSPLVSVHKSKIGNTDVLQYIVGVRKGRKLVLIKEGYEDEFIKLLCEEEAWNTYVYNNAEEYNKDRFSNCAEFTIVSSEKILNEIKENAYNRVVVINPKELSTGGRKLVDNCPEENRLKKENYLKIIYARFAHEDASNIDKTIQIDDGEASEIFFNGITTECEPDSCEYCYLKHLDGNNEWKGFKSCLTDGLFNKIQYIESVTGNNSTARLIRQCVLDEYWYYEQLHSMKSHVAIFDERFFDSETLNARKVILYKLAGTYLFNINIDVKNSSGNFDVFGFVPKDDYSDNNQLVKIGELSLVLENQQIKLSLYPQYKCTYPDFDYISIHQGILDKIYGHIGLGTESANRIDKMIGVTNEIVREINKFRNAKLTIHSGRGNVEKSKMPQHVPFIQYSALKAALNDCKYSLVSLFSYAKYESK